MLVWYVVQPRPLRSRVYTITIELGFIRIEFTNKVCFVVQRADCHVPGLTCGRAEVWIAMVVQNVICFGGGELGAGGGLERILLFTFQCSIVMTHSTIAAVFLALVGTYLEEECNVSIWEWRSKHSPCIKLMWVGSVRMTLSVLQLATFQKRVHHIIRLPCPWCARCSGRAWKYFPLRWIYVVCFDWWSRITCERNWVTGVTLSIVKAMVTGFVERVLISFIN